MDGLETITIEALKTVGAIFILLAMIGFIVLVASKSDLIEKIIFGFIIIAGFTLGITMNSAASTRHSQYRYQCIQAYETSLYEEFKDEDGEVVMLCRSWINNEKVWHPELP